MIELEGELNVATAAQLKEVLDDTRGDVVLDLSQLHFVDPTGIGVLIARLRAARERGERFVLRKPAPQLRRLLAVSGLANVFEIES